MVKVLKVLLVVGTIGLLASNIASAQKPWAYRCFGTLDGMVNQLGGYREFHIVAVPSSRNPLGWAGDPYCVVYR